MQVFRFSGSKRRDQKVHLEDADTNENRTEVHLVGFFDNYRDAGPKTAATISRRIIEHCMEYFVFGKVPKFFLHDEDERDKYDLLRMFRHEILLAKSHIDIEIKNKKFRITHVRTTASTDSENRLCYCAHGCAVKAENLKAKIPNLQRASLCEGGGKQFHYLGLVLL